MDTLIGKLAELTDTIIRRVSILCVQETKQVVIKPESQSCKIIKIVYA